MRICPECERRTDEPFCPFDGAGTMDETWLAQGKDPMIGRIIAGRYRVLELLGRGGMGRVYRAEQLAMKRHVALKVIQADATAEASERLGLVKRFQREGMAASRLEHPNTVRVFDFGHSDDGTLFLAMELLRGQPLGRVTRREGPMPASRAIGIALQVCKSLAEAHAKGIVHRDLKPDNIFLADVAGEEDFVKVLDFGIAKIIEANTGESSITRTGVIIGTPAYMAPEQASGAGVTALSDLYALGVILFEALSGRQPYTGDTPISILMKHASAPIPPLVEGGMPPGVPPALEALVRGLMAKRPSDRPVSAIAVGRELEALRRDMVTEERAVGLPLPSSTSTPVPVVSPDPRVETAPKPHQPDAETFALPGDSPALRTPTPKGGTLIEAASEEDFRDLSSFSTGRRRRSWTAWLVAALAVVGVAAAVFLATRGTDSDAGVPAASEAATIAAPLPAPAAVPPAVAVDPAPEAPAAEAPAAPVPEPADPPVPPAKTVAAPSAPADTAKPAALPRVAESPRPAAAPARKEGPPRCATLRCPFDRDCLDADGKRVSGAQFCFPTF